MGHVVLNIMFDMLMCIPTSMTNMGIHYLHADKVSLKAGPLRINTFFLSSKKKVPKTTKLEGGA